MTDKIQKDVATRIEEARQRHALAIALIAPPYEALVLELAMLRAVNDELLTMLNASATRTHAAEQSLINTLGVLADFDKQFAVKNARNAATKKNLTAREYVLAEWESKKTHFKGKADFARSYAPILKSKFGLEITTRQIETEWLPKTKNSA